MIGEPEPRREELDGLVVGYRLLDMDDDEWRTIGQRLTAAGVRFEVSGATLRVHPDDEATADAVLDEIYGPSDGLDDVDGDPVGGDPAGGDPVGGDPAGGYPADGRLAAAAGDPEWRLHLEELAATGGPVYDLEGCDEDTLAVLVDRLERARVRFAVAPDGGLVVHRNDEHHADAVLDEVFGPDPTGPDTGRT